MLTGSDVGVAWVVPGWSIHQEMARLVALGVAPIEAIRGATIYGAEASRVADRFGSIEAGRSGDLVLLERDPLQDITATRAIRAVVARGRVLPAATGGSPARTQGQ
jgi:imidazolonepropionase-like amidohydrolase